VTVALTTGDAQALALTPTCDGIQRLRVIALVESVLGRVDARLRSVNSPRRIGVCVGPHHS